MVDVDDVWLSVAIRGNGRLVPGQLINENSEGASVKGFLGRIEFGEIARFLGHSNIGFVNGISKANKMNMARNILKGIWIEEERHLFSNDPFFSEFPQEKQKISADA